VRERETSERRERARQRTRERERGRKDRRENDRSIGREGESARERRSERKRMRRKEWAGCEHSAFGRLNMKYMYISHIFSYRKMRMLIYSLQEHTYISPPTFRISQKFAKQNLYRSDFTDQ